MKQSAFEPYRRAFKAIGPIIFRNVFLLINAIIFTVSILLIVFGETSAGIFLGAITVFNIVLGVAQDFRSRVALEKLQLLTAPRFTLVHSDGSEETVLIEEIQKGDQVKLKIGDQIPCDGTLIDANNLEVSEALLTGESDSFPKNKGESVLAGAIVTSGSGLVQVETIFSGSRISRMTDEIKKYTINPSPIQRSINILITYSGYALILVIIFVIVRGIMTGMPAVSIVNTVGALASTIVPQGMVVMTTLLFAFGAASYSRQKVLFQEINATEKLGRIKNVCMDKTGTLTDNMLVVEKTLIPPGIEKTDVEKMARAYIVGSGDSSQTIRTLDAFLGTKKGDVEIVDALPFSSWRQYGAVRVKKSDDTEKIIFVGPADIFLNNVSDEKEKTWLRDLVKIYTENGKRMLCVAESKSKKGDIPRELTGVSLSILSVFVFKSGLREGIIDAIQFFQDRGVRIRIISGDNAETVVSVAKAAGVKNADAKITGRELEEWDTADFEQKTKDYTVFARIVPEQKVKIVEALRRDGFTAMVGDGANDALAIKRADLGIAMFDGAPATRGLASVVLMNNSFSALPGGVKLADNYIRSLEIFASIFINQALLGLFFFIIISFFGYAYPLLPLNITFINYFTVGIPGLFVSYWALRPRENILPPSTRSFLWRVLPYTALASLLCAIGASFVFLSSSHISKIVSSSTLVIITFIFLSYVFFTLLPRMFFGSMLLSQKKQMIALALIEIVLIYIAFHWQFVVTFFTMNSPSPKASSIFALLAVGLVYFFVQYVLIERFFLKRRIVRSRA